MNPLVRKIIESESLSDRDIFECRGMDYTFLNPVSYLEARECPDIFLRMRGVFADGNLLAKAIDLKHGSMVSRRSFDMTSLAGRLFIHASDTGKSVYFVGASDEEIGSAGDIIGRQYPRLDIAGMRGGYFRDACEVKSACEEIVRRNPAFVIVGMGVCRQEKFLAALRSAGYGGIGFTCGGFFSQLAAYGLDYYPRWVNRLNLRFIYRFIKEPHTRRRYVSAFFKFPLKFLTSAD